MGKGSPALALVALALLAEGAAATSAPGKHRRVTRLHVGGSISAVDADGRHLRTLRPVFSSDAVSSSDGRKIVFVAADKADVEHLFTMRPDGRGVRRIPLVRPTPSNGLPSRPRAVWSRGEKRIYYVGSVAGHDETLVVSNADGGGARDLVPSVSRVFSFDLAPAGRRIAIAADDGRRRDIYVVDTDGTELRRLTTARRIVNDNPRWSPDGHSSHSSASKAVAPTTRSGS